MPKEEEEDLEDLPKKNLEVITAYENPTKIQRNRLKSLAF